MRIPETANQSDFDYRTQHRNLCNKHMSAGTHHDHHGYLHEHERFVARAERRRLLRHQTVKWFSEAYVRIFVYVNAITADICSENISINLVFK